MKRVKKWLFKNGLRPLDFEYGSFLIRARFLQHECNYDYFSKFISHKFFSIQINSETDYDIEIMYFDTKDVNEIIFENLKDRYGRDDVIYFFEKTVPKFLEYETQSPELSDWLDSVVSS